MSRFQPDIGGITECGSEVLQGYFVITEPEPVTDTQRDFPYPNPDVIPVKKRTISRTGIEQGNKAITCDINTGMQTGY